MHRLLISILALVVLSFNPVIAIELTTAERAYLNQHGALQLCIDPHWMPYEGIDGQGQYTGISADYMAYIADAIDHPIVLLPTQSWQETLESAKNRRCDIIPMARETVERKAFLDFTNPYISFPYIVASTHGADYLADLSNHTGKTFAVVAGYSVYKDLKARYPDMDLILVKSLNEGIQKLRSGEAFGYIDSLLAVGFYISRQGALDIKVNGETHYSSAVAIASRNDAPILNTILQKALNSIPDQTKQAIHNEWVKLQYENAPQIEPENRVTLTAEEQQYIQNNPKVSMCIDPNWMPYEALEDGQHIGIGGDILRLISERSQIEIELFSTSSWAETLKQFRAGNCDILSMLNRTPERDQYIDYTRPYFNGHIVFVAKNEHPYIADPQEIAGKKVAVTTGYSISEFLKRDFPDIELVEVEDYDLAFEMVATGQVDLTADYLISSGDRIQRMGLYGLKIAGNTPYKNQLAIGVQKDNIELLRILDKTVATLKKHEVEAIINKWRSVRYEHTVNYSLLWQISGTALFLIAITVFWNHRLRQAKARTQEALDKLAEAQKTLETLAVTDKLTGLFNRLKIDAALEEGLYRAHRFDQPFSLIMLDLDHFKTVNDNYGHQTGDKVLVHLAKILQQNTRATDLVGRWGGEEFMILCQATELSAANQLAEKIRYLVAAYEFPNAGKNTCSFGVATYCNDDTIDTLLARVDKGLYQSKATGRNRITIIN